MAGGPAIDARVTLVAVVALVALATPALAEERTERCTVDVGAPFLLVDHDGEGDEGPAIGGCLLVHGTDQRYKITEANAADWGLTPVGRDCAFLVGGHGDGGYEPVGLGDPVPAGANLWAKCETGTLLANELTLEPT